MLRNQNAQRLHGPQPAETANARAKPSASNPRNEATDLPLRRDALRNRFVDETEAFLDAELRRERRPWPNRCNPKPPVGPPAARRRETAEDHVVTRVYLASIVDVSADQNGLIEDDAILSLIKTLRSVADDHDAGDVIIDLSQVSSLTAQLINVIASLQDRCRRQNRRVLLCGGGVSHAVWLRRAGVPMPWFVSKKQAILHVLLACADENR